MNKYLKNRDWLHEQYTIQKKSTAQIGEEINVKKGTVWYYVKKFNLKQEQNLSYRNKEWLHQQYVELDRTKRTIAKECEVSEETIKVWVDHFELRKKEKERYFCQNKFCHKEITPTKRQLKQRYMTCSRTCASILQKTIPSRYEGEYFASKEWLYQKYIVEEISQQDIADEVRVTRKTINRLLLFHEIERDKFDYSTLDDPEWLYEEYIIQNKTADCIAFEVGVNTSSIRRRLSKYEIKKLDTSHIDFSYRDEKWLRHKVEIEKIVPYRISLMCNVYSNAIYKYMERYCIVYTPPFYPELNNEEWLEREYLFKNRTIDSLATQFDVTHNYIFSSLSKFNLKKRPVFHDISYKNEDWLRAKVEKEKLTRQEIADMFGLKSISTINYLCMKYNIKAEELPVRDKEWLFEEYVIKGKKADEIGKELGISGKTVVAWAAVHGIKKRDYIEEGSYKDEKYLIQCLEDGLTLREIADIQNTHRDNVHHYATKYHLNHLFRKETSIEYMMRRFLEDEGIEHEPQYKIPNSKYIADFYLEQLQLIIEVDGDYWHSTPEAIKKDKRRDKFCIENGYKVVRFWESEINHDFDNVKQIVLTLTSTP